MQHISSRQSLEAATSVLLTGAATLDDTGLGALGQDLNSVGALLVKEPALRRILADNTTEGDAKASIVTSLLAGKVGPAAAKVVDTAVRREWTTGADLAEGVYRLARTANFLRAERGGELDEVEEELFRFGRVLEAHPELAAALDNPTAVAADRVALVERLLAGKAHGLTISLLTALAEDTRGRSFAHGVNDLVEQAANRRDKVVAVITSPVELNTEQRNRAIAALTKIYGRPVTAHVQVDPTLQGGLKIRVGDEVIDGSVSGRLTELKARLGG